MDKTFKKHFILNGYIAHVIKRKSGKNGFYYEIRYRRNGYNIRAASVDINEAKRIFLEKTTKERDIKEEGEIIFLKSEKKY